jgi:hypothetical protein
LQIDLETLRQIYELLRSLPEREAQDILSQIRRLPPGPISLQSLRDIAGGLRLEYLQLDSPLTDGPEIHFAPLPATLTAASSPAWAAVNGNFGESLIGASRDLPGTGAAIGNDSEAHSKHEHYLGHANEDPLVERRGFSLPLPIVVPNAKSPTEHETSDSRLAAAKSWTRVRTDEGMLSHLMSLWHTWEYTYWHFLDWDLFLDDMSSGQTNFCSALLVNAMLSSACSQSSRVKDRSKPFANNIMTDFYNEARRLWAAEEGTESLTRIQAAMCIYMILGKFGRDKVGHTFLTEACRMARDMGLFRLGPCPAWQKPKGVSWEKWERARGVTTWALFNFQLSLSMSYSFPVIIRAKPPIPIPYEDSPDKEALFRSECGRHSVMVGSLNTLVDVDGTLRKSLSPASFEKLLDQFTTWWESRPASLDPEHNSSPQNLLAAMQFNVAVIRLIRFYFMHDPSDDSQPHRRKARRLVATSTQKLRSLLSLHDIVHGWNLTIGYVLDPIVVACHFALDELAASDAPSKPVSSSGSQPFKTPLTSNEAYMSLQTCLRALRGLSDFVFYAQPLFRVMGQICDRLGIEMPAVYADRVGEYRSSEWTNRACGVLASQYVAELWERERGWEDARLDKVVLQWRPKENRELEQEDESVGADGD